MSANKKQRTNPEEHGGGKKSSKGSGKGSGKGASVPSTLYLLSFATICNFVMHSPE